MTGGLSEIFHWLGSIFSRERILKHRVYHTLTTSCAHHASWVAAEWLSSAYPPRFVQPCLCSSMTSGPALLLVPLVSCADCVMVVGCADCAGLAGACLRGPLLTNASCVSPACLTSVCGWREEMDWQNISRAHLPCLHRPRHIHACASSRVNGAQTSSSRIPWDRGASMEASIPGGRRDLQAKGDGGGGARVDLRERGRG